MRHLEIATRSSLSTSSQKTLLARATGKFYTHRIISDHLVTALSQRLPQRDISIVDPFCGDGRLIVALLTAASVAACGIIGFVGLVVPHAVRTFARPLHRTLLPLVFAGGGSFLVLSDIVSRTVVRPLELPVGVITALVGVPIFALLLRRSVT